MTILSTPEARRLGSKLATMQQEIDSLRAAQRATQLGNSTLYGAIYIADPDGTVKGIVGEQADGSTGVVVTDGPAPPTPSTPSLTPLMSGVDVAWSGTFTAAKPLNFSHVNVYLSDAGPDFVHGPSNMVGTLSDAGSIPVAPLPSGTQWWARLVAVNDSVPPKVSEPSLTVGPVEPDQVVAQDVLDGIVTEVKLANDAVTQAKIAAGAVGTGEIAGQAVTLSQLANGSVDATKLTDAAVTTPKIAANAVTANELAANSVIAGKLAADSVQTNNLVAGSVSTLKLAAEAVSADKIAANAVTAEKINALAVTADKVSANAINAGHIQAGAVTASKLAATLVLGSTLIAGTGTTGARVQLNSGGIEAFRSNGMKVMDFDVVSGDMTIAGRYRSQDSGTRVEINPGGNAPDEIRFYQGSVYGYIGAESAPGGTAAVSMNGSGSNRGKVVAYPGEGATGWATPSLSQSAISCLADAANIWGGTVNIEGRDAYGTGAVSFTWRNSSNAIDGRRTLQYVGGGSGEPVLRAPNYDTQIVWTSAGLVIQSQAGTTKQVIASNVGASSRAVKKGERPIAFRDGRSAVDLIEALVPKMWNYADEWVEGEPRPRRTRTVTGDVIRDDQGRAMVDPDTLLPLREPDRVEEIDPGQPVKPHLGLMAEDVAAVAPELVQPIPTEAGGLGLADRDLTAVVWLAQREQNTNMRALAAQGGDLAARVKKLEEAVVRLNIRP